MRLCVLVCVCVFANATNCRGALIRSFIHSFSHSFRSRSLVSQSVRQARQSFSRCQNCHAPRPHRHPHPRPGPSLVSRAVSQLGIQSGQSTFSIDVARLRTHIADSWTKQSPVSNSVRHSLTESCLPFISICQSGQQAARYCCCSQNSSSSISQSSFPAPLRPLQLRTQFSLLFIVYCFLCAVLFATLCATRESAEGGRQR